nr:hypothetical protein [Tanacetum cinerariifolium]GFA26833.1 hypothetical protein [Tanacetum cinerariifolium]
TMADMNSPINDASAEQAPTIVPPTRNDDQIFSLRKWVPIGKSNCILDVQKSHRNLIFSIVFWDTMCFDSSIGLYNCQLDKQWFNLHKDILRDALDITPIINNNSFVAPPTSDTVIEYVNTLGYRYTLRNVSTMSVNALYQPWRAILSMINMCLTGKHSKHPRNSVAVDDVPAAADEPSIPSLTPTTQPPPPSLELPSTSQVQPTPPPSPIAQPPLPQQQPQPLQPLHNAESSMDLLHTLLETCTTLTKRVEHLKQDKIAQTLEITKLKQRVKKLERRNKLKVSKLRRLKRVGTAQRVDTYEDTVMDDVSKHGEIIATIDADEDVILKDVATIAKEPVELKDGVEVVTTAKLITEVVTVASATITAATNPITAATLTAAPSAARRRNGVLIRDPEETATPSIIIHFEPKSKDKGKGIMVEEPKPLEKQAQIE